MRGISVHFQIRDYSKNFVKFSVKVLPCIKIKITDLYLTKISPEKLTMLFIWLILTIKVSITNPRVMDACKIQCFTLKFWFSTCSPCRKAVILITSILTIFIPVTFPCALDAMWVITHELKLSTSIICKSQKGEILFLNLCISAVLTPQYDLQLFTYRLFQ